MEFTVAQIAEIISAEVQGDPNAVIKTVCKIEESFEGGLTFLANPKYTHYLYETKATAAIVNDDFVPDKEVPCILIKVSNAYLAFATLLDVYNKMKSSKTGISKQAYIAESATIGKDVYIAEFVSIGENVTVGDHTKLYPHVCLGDNVKVGQNTVLNSGVKIYADCVVGNHCIIHAGSVIGADGFGFAAQDGAFTKVPQIGNVIIEDHVEIGANTCVDRATMGSTKIHHNVKIDNLVQIAHNVEVGEGSAFAAQSGVSGSTKIGKHCILAGQVGVAGHITIGDQTIIGAQSGVSNSLKGGEAYLGSPAIPIGEERRLIIYRKKLPSLFKEINRIGKQFENKENQ